MKVCPKCGKEESHFVPPSLGEVGFFICEVGSTDKVWVIRSKSDHDLYWSNKQGWVDTLYPPDYYTKEEKEKYGLPIESEWVKVRR